MFGHDRCGRLGLRRLDDNLAGPVPIPDRAWRGIEAVRLSGQTNMLNRPRVAHLARRLGFPEATRWIEEHPREYAAAIFRGFAPEPEGGKSECAD